MNTHLKCSKVLKIKIFRKLKNTLAKKLDFLFEGTYFKCKDANKMTRYVSCY